MNSPHASTHPAGSAPTPASTNEETDIPSPPKPPTTTNTHTAHASPYEPHRPPLN